MAAKAIEISVISWENVKQDSGKYTIYTLIVTYSGKQWTIKRRFSELSSFNEHIEKYLGSQHPFPPKTLTSLGNFEPEFVEKRRLGLEAYFKSVASQLPKVPQALQMLGYENPNIESKSVYTKITFVPATWPPAAIKSLPDQLAIDGTVVYYRDMCVLIAHLIFQLQQIEEQISSTSSLEKRLTILESNKASINSLVQQLNANLATLSDVVGADLLTQPQIQTSTELLDIAVMSMNWALEVDHVIYSTIDATSSQHSNNSLEEMLPTLRQQVEVSLALLVSAQSPQELKSALDTIDSTLKILKTNVKVAAIRHSVETKEKFLTLQQMLEETLRNATKDPAFKITESGVTELEEKMFQFIHRSENLTDGCSTEHQVTINAHSLISDLDKFRTELARVRNALEQSHDVANTNFLNRIGDLQEHLGELHFQVREKYLSAPVAAPSRINDDNDAFEL